MLAAEHLTVPWSLTLHGISETDYPAGLLLPDKIASAQFVACASYFMQAQAMRQVSPDQWHKFRIVRCGVDSRRLGKMTTNAASSGLTKLICVGRLSPEKGHLGLIEALSNMRKRGLNCHLCIVGDGPLRQAIKDLIKKLNLCDQVSLLGFMDENATLKTMVSSDILVLPSFMEGLPVVLIEALAIGKPVVASRVAGIPELVEHGSSGLLFTPSDFTELERSLEQIITDRSNWLTFGASGKFRVSSEFDSATNAKIMREMFSLSLSNVHSAE